MNVFLSWSGEMSHKVAVLLRDWLPMVLQVVKPYESSEDAVSGSRWGDSIKTQLHDSSYGIVCLTPYNTHSRWLHFEAGALFNAFGPSRVTPLLFRMSQADVIGPLQQFQSAACTETGILRLVSSINQSLSPELQLDVDRIKREFTKWWPELEPHLNEIEDGIESSSDMPPLLLERQLLVIQQKPCCKAVWVITPDPQDSDLEHVIWECIAKNVQRGVLYTFLVPESKCQDEALLRLVELGKRSMHEVTIRGIDDDAFSRLAVTEYIVVNPADSTPQVFFEIPAEPRGFWLEVMGAAAQGFVKRFDTMRQSRPLATLVDRQA
jgi:hypothetical protein